MPSRYAELVQPHLDDFRFLRRQQVFDVIIQQIMRQADLFGPGAAGGLPGSVELSDLGPVLAAARAARRVGLRELAAETRIDHKTISRIERGRANPTLGTLQRIAAALGKKLQVALVDEAKDQPLFDPQPKEQGPGVEGPAEEGPAEQEATPWGLDHLFPNPPELAELPPSPSLDELFGHPLSLLW